MTGTIALAFHLTLVACCLLPIVFIIFEDKCSESFTVLISFIIGAITVFGLTYINASDEKLCERELLDQKYHELIQEEDSKISTSENQQPHLTIANMDGVYEAVYTINGKTVETIYKKRYNTIKKQYNTIKRKNHNGN